MRLAVQKGAFMMQQLRAWLLSLGIALLLVIVVRSFAFAIYRVPAASVLRQGDRVMVNMLAHGNYKRGQLGQHRKRPNPRALPRYYRAGFPPFLPAFLTRLPLFNFQTRSDVENSPAFFHLFWPCSMVSEATSL